MGNVVLKLLQKRHAVEGPLGRDPGQTRCPAGEAMLTVCKAESGAGSTRRWAPGHRRRSRRRPALPSALDRASLPGGPGRGRTAPGRGAALGSGRARLPSAGLTRAGWVVATLGTAPRRALQGTERQAARPAGGLDTVTDAGMQGQVTGSRRTEKSSGELGGLPGKPFTVAPTDSGLEIPARMSGGRWRN